MGGTFSPSVSLVQNTSSHTACAIVQSRYVMGYIYSTLLSLRSFCCGRSTSRRKFILLIFVTIRIIERFLPREYCYRNDEMLDGLLPAAVSLLVCRFEMRTSAINLCSALAVNDSRYTLPPLICEPECFEALFKVTFYSDRQKLKEENSMSNKGSWELE